VISFGVAGSEPRSACNIRTDPEMYGSGSRSTKIIRIQPDPDLQHYRSAYQFIFRGNNRKCAKRASKEFPIVFVKMREIITCQFLVFLLAKSSHHKTPVAFSTVQTYILHIASGLPRNFSLQSLKQRTVWGSIKHLQKRKRKKAGRSYIVGRTLQLHCNRLIVTSMLRTDKAVPPYTYILSISWSQGERMAQQTANQMLAFHCLNF